jgi:integrase
VRGVVGTPKTAEAMAPIPLIDPVRVPLELWRQKCDGATEGWLFPSDSNTPATLNNYVNRIIKPHVNGKARCIPCDRVPEKSGVTWKQGGLYCGRRGACTEAIEKTNGNYAIAQALLRHKRMTTTLNVYKKQITPDAFKAGMKLLEAAASSSKQRK